MANRANWTEEKREREREQHDTGLVRGLLCNDCNLGIGRLKDDPTRVAKALVYLSKPQTNDGF